MKITPTAENFARSEKIVDRYLSTFPDEPDRNKLLHCRVEIDGNMWALPVPDDEMPAANADAIKGLQHLLERAEADLSFTESEQEENFLAAGRLLATASRTVERIEGYKAGIAALSA